MVHPIYILEGEARIALNPPFRHSYHVRIAVAVRAGLRFYANPEYAPCSKTWRNCDPA